MKIKSYRHVLFLFCSTVVLYSCKQPPVTVVDVVAMQQKIDSTLTTDKAIDSFIKPYRNHLNKQLDSVLCIALVDITKSDGVLESSLGNLMADIALHQTQPIFYKRHQKKIDFVLMNHGGIRAPILKGPVTARIAFEVMPFENELVAVELSYDKVMELVSYLMEKERAHPIANLELHFSKGTKEIKKLSIDEKPIIKGKSYLVLTTDYLQQGGDSMVFFEHPIQLYKTDYKLRNVLIDYFKTLDTIQVALDNRLGYAK